MTRRKCSECRKPLGNAAGTLCHDCGGVSYRSGPRITREQWGVLLGA